MAFSMSISIHPSRVGWDRSGSGWGLGRAPISIHPSRVGWDSHARSCPHARHNFNPPIPCGMGPACSPKPCDGHPISIHPSRVGWDCNTAGCCWSHVNFNPPIPCGMGLGDLTWRDLYLRFQSTHPVWDGTFPTFVSVSLTNPFQSTHPVWDGTRSGSPAATCSHFNPPIPCGMGRLGRRCRVPRSVFQSTHPVWDGTTPPTWAYGASEISIHPSRVGWDSHVSTAMIEPTIFQSTHPVWDGTGDTSSSCTT